MIRLQNVLVATDFGEASATALTYGRDLARTFGGTLHVLHVVEDVMARAVASEAYTIDFSELQRRFEESAREQLDRIVAEDDRRELGARPVVRRATTPALAIVAYAKRRTSI